MYTELLAAEYYGLRIGRRARHCQCRSFRVLQCTTLVRNASLMLKSFETSVNFIVSQRRGIHIACFRAKVRQTPVQTQKRTKIKFLFCTFDNRRRFFLCENRV